MSLDDRNLGEVDEDSWVRGISSHPCTSLDFFKLGGTLTRAFHVGSFRRDLI